MNTDDQNPHSVAAFIRAARVTDDPVGDFISDMRGERHVPAFKSSAEVRSFLRFRGACRGASTTVPYFWQRYKRWVARKRRRSKLGKIDLAKSIEHGRAVDPVRCAALELIENWAEHLVPGRSYGVRGIIECANERKQTGSMGDFEFVRPDFCKLLLVEASKNGRDIDATALGKYRLGKIAGQVHSGYRIEAAAEQSARKRAKGTKWRLSEWQFERERTLILAASGKATVRKALCRKVVRRIRRIKREETLASGNSP